MHRSSFFPIAVLMLASPVGLEQASAGKVEIIVLDKAAAKPVPCRVHLKDAAGKPVGAGKLPFWRDHFVCTGIVQLDLAPGTYSYEIERGPEYRSQSGKFSVAENGTVKIQVELERLADLAAEGWWSGELHVHRPPGEMELLMGAEDLHVAPVITWWNKRNLWTDQPPPRNLLVRFDSNRFYHVMAGEDEREGGALLYFHLSRPLAITEATREYPSPMKYVAVARKHAGVWIDIEKPFWWDVPVWLAGGQVDSIGLANNHMCRSQMYETEAWGKPRDIRLLPPPRGNGMWTQEIYYHILNCGLHLPPSAGSASGVLPNPVGYNRVYVHEGKDLTYEKWWDGLRAGRCFVTNGPLLRARAAGQLPGHVFTAPAGQTLDLDIQVQLSGRDSIRSVDIIKNGRVERSMSAEEWAKTGRLGTVAFKESGWFLVRVLADEKKTFRFASTAPWYVKIGTGPRRISRASAQFFLDWARERTERVKLADQAQRWEVLVHHFEAEKYWGKMVASANAD